MNTSKPPPLPRSSTTSPGFKRGERGGIAAGKSHVRAFGQRLEFLDGVAEFASQFFGLLRRGAAAGNARATTTGGGFLGNAGVAFADEFADGITWFFSLVCFHKSAAFLPSADDGKIGFQNLLQFLRVGFGFIRPGQRFADQAQRFAHRRQARFYLPAGNKPTAPTCAR